MSNTTTQLDKIHADIKALIAQNNAFNIQLEEMKNSITSKDLKLEELTKLVRDMLVKQDMVCIDTISNQKVVVKASSSSTPSTTNINKTITVGKLGEIPFGNVREFFKTVFPKEKNIFMVRENPNEFKSEYGIIQNGFLTEERINTILDKDKEKTAKTKKSLEELVKKEANKIYGELTKEERSIVICIKDEMYNFIEKQKQVDLSVDGVEPDN